jgi:hypothetical protein
VTTRLAPAALSILKLSKVPIPTSAFVMFAFVIVPVVIVPVVIVDDVDSVGPTNLLAVIIPLVFALKLDDNVDAKLTLPVPSKDMVLASISPPILKSLAVSSLVVVAAIPLVTPVTSPSTVPLNVFAVIIPLATIPPSAIPTPIPESGFNPT